MRCWNPRCANDELANNAIYCPECKTDRPRASTKGEPSDKSKLVQKIRDALVAKPPTSWDLTDQQWYNVCKFYPSVAMHCERPFPDIGPGNPLGRTAKRGSVLYFKPVYVREPGEEG